MRQIFLLILLFVVGQWLVKALRRADARGSSAREGTPRGAPRRAPAGRLPEPMIRCAECGVHAPRSESVSASGQSFCCAEHARLHAARHAGERGAR